MSYARDRDASVRGVGAVAARDFGNGRTRALRIARARALNDRDRALSRFTYGPSGGMGAVKAGEELPDYSEIKPRPRQPPLPYYPPGSFPPGTNTGIVPPVLVASAGPQNTGIVPPHLDPRVTMPVPTTSTTTSVLETPAPPAKKKPNLLVVGGLVLAVILLTRKS